jgi:hypothetical protein
MVHLGSNSFSINEPLEPVRQVSETSPQVLPSSTTTVPESEKESDERVHLNTESKGQKRKGEVLVGRPAKK